VPRRSDIRPSDYAIPGRLREARARNGWTRAELARKSGVTAYNIQKYEDGLAIPGAENVRRLCKALRVSADWMIDVAGWDARQMSGSEGVNVAEKFREVDVDGKRLLSDFATLVAEHQNASKTRA